MRTLHFFAVVSLLLLPVFGTGQTLLFEEDFDSTDLGPFTVLQTDAGDTEVESGYDYSAASIPAAPNGSGTLGLRTACNIASGATQAVNLYLPTPVTVSRFQVQVDIWLSFADSGTTEHTGVGIFGSGTKINSPTIYGTLPTDTDGLTFGYNSDSDEARSDLYLALGDAAGPTDVGLWSNPDDSTPLAQYSTAPYYDPVADLGTVDIFGEQWITVTITYLEGLVTVQMDDLLVVSYVDFSLATSGNNLVYLVHTDPFGSIANLTADSFCIFDNLKVFEIPLPLSAQNWTLYQ